MLGTVIDPVYPWWLSGPCAVASALRSGRTICSDVIELPPDIDASVPMIPARTAELLPLVPMTRRTMLRCCNYGSWPRQN